MLRPAVTFLLAGLCAAQVPTGVTAGPALDKEILHLKDVPDDARPRAIRDIAVRIRTAPIDLGDRVALAFNLTNEADLSDGADTLQEVVTTLAEALRDAQARDKAAFHYLRLAEIVRYEHMQTSLDDAKYLAAVARLEADDKRRSEADFTLTDIHGTKWNLKSLRGKVVLVNFWATWCPPCVKELPDLEAVYERFRDQGLVILGISDEDPSKLLPFVAQRKIDYPVLTDPGGKTGEAFEAPAIGIPESFLYDRDGHLVEPVIDTPTRQRLLEMLGRVGLH
jgi:peroxiredoxin